MLSVVLVQTYTLATGAVGGGVRDWEMVNKAQSATSAGSRAFHVKCSRQHKQPFCTKHLQTILKSPIDLP